MLQVFGKCGLWLKKALLNMVLFLNIIFNFQWLIDLFIFARILKQGAGGKEKGSFELLKWLLFFEHKICIRAIAE